MRSCRPTHVILAGLFLLLLPGKDAPGLIGQAQAMQVTNTDWRRRAEEARLRAQAEAREARARWFARWRDFETACLQAQQMIKRGDLTAAKDTIDKQAKEAKALGSDAINQLESVRYALDEACRKVLQAADKDYAAGKYKDAIKQYALIAARMDGLPAAKEASRKLQAARNDPVVRAAAREADAEDGYSTVAAIIEAQRKAMIHQADAQAGEGAPAPKQPSDIEAIAKMTIPKKAALLVALEGLKNRYADTEAGKKATNLLTQLQADKELIGAVKQWQDKEKVRQLFEKAQTYETNKMPDKAIGFYEELLRNYPDSEYAEKAKACLAELRKASK